MKVIFACGGTGGHIYPAIAVAEELLKMDKDAEILFVGSMNGMEKGIIEKKGFNFRGVDVRPLIRKFTAGNIVNGFYAVRSVFDAGKIVKDFNPDFTAGTGGFVSFPAIMASAMAGKKTLIHEPNIVPGLANRFLGCFCKVITAGFPDTAAYFQKGKTVVTGNPVRASILKDRRAEALDFFNLSADLKTVLIMPGSRAAKSINRTMIESFELIEKELKGVQFIWMTGDKDFDAAGRAALGHPKVRTAVYKFIDDAGLAYSIADAGVLRAGAGTLTELTEVKLPSVLVPYPYATDNHQEKNAAAFETRKAAVLLKDSCLTPENFVKALKEVLDPVKSAKMKDELAKMRQGGGAGRIAKILTGEIK